MYLGAKRRYTNTLPFLSFQLLLRTLFDMTTQQGLKTGKIPKRLHMCTACHYAENRSQNMLPMLLQATAARVCVCVCVRACVRVIDQTTFSLPK